MTTLYIKVSDDEYRLPEKIATTPRELAEWCEEMFGDVLTDVIAWMPLPEPYKEDENA